MGGHRPPPLPADADLLTALLATPEALPALARSSACLSALTNAVAACGRGAVIDPGCPIRVVACLVPVAVAALCADGHRTLAGSLAVHALGLAEALAGLDGSLAVLEPYLSAQARFCRRYPVGQDATGSAATVLPGLYASVMHSPLLQSIEFGSLSLHV
jgi:hypothetical protein